MMYFKIFKFLSINLTLIVLFSCQKNDIEEFVNSITKEKKEKTTNISEEVLISKHQTLNEGKYSRKIDIKGPSAYFSGQIEILENGALYIESGTTIFMDHKKPTRIIVRKKGVIFAVGGATNENEKITFTSAKEPRESRAYGDWQGIVIMGEGKVNVRNKNLETEFTEYGLNSDENTNKTQEEISKTSSGILNHINIKFAGKNDSPSLCLLAPGENTNLRNIEITPSKENSIVIIGEEPSSLTDIKPDPLVNKKGCSSSSN